MAPREEVAFVRAALGPLVESRTYARVAHFLIGLPLGIAYVSYLATMFAVGFALSFTLVGLPVVGYALTSARSLTVFECRLIRRLLGDETPTVPRLPSGRGRVIDVALARIRDRDAWRNVLYVCLRFPVATFSFAVTVALGSGIVLCLGLPFWVAAGGFGDLGGWRIDTLGESLVFVVPGLALLVVAPQVLAGLSWVTVSITRRMVGRMPYEELRLAAVRVLAGGRELAGPTIVREIARYGGRSFDITAANIYAVLRGLVASGMVEPEEGGELDRYSLTPLGESMARTC